MPALFPSPLSVVSSAREVCTGSYPMGLSLLFLIPVWLSLHGPNVSVANAFNTSLLLLVPSVRKIWPGIAPMGLPWFVLMLLLFPLRGPESSDPPSPFTALIYGWFPRSFPLCRLFSLSMLKIWPGIVPVGLAWLF